jgi:hypothetical protein
VNAVQSKMTSKWRCSYAGRLRVYKSDQGMHRESATEETDLENVEYEEFNVEGLDIDLRNSENEHGRLIL